MLDSPNPLGLWADVVEPGTLVLAKRSAFLGNGRCDLYRCVTCESSYHAMYEWKDGWSQVGPITCNKHTIDKCPWCRHDSEPWKYGRGK